MTRRSLMTLLATATIENRLPWIRTLKGSIANTLGLQPGHMDVLNQLESEGGLPAGHKIRSSRALPEAVC
jgi:hypothetical protein